MSLRAKENAIKLEILAAVARSQTALAKIAESVADAPIPNTADSGEIARSLMVLARFQQNLTEKLLLMKLHSARSGKPGQPWLHDAVSCTLFDSTPFTRITKKQPI